MNDCEKCHIYHVKEQDNLTKIQVVKKMENNPHKVQHMEDVIIGKKKDGKNP